MKKKFVKLPNISISTWIPHIPYISLSSPIVIGITIFMASVSIVVGILFAAFVADDMLPTFPDDGAVYTAPSRIGERLPLENGLTNHTLEFRPAGSSINNIVFVNMNLDPPSGNGITVNASTTQTGILTCSQIIFKNISGPSLTMVTDIEAYSLTGLASSTEVDGSTITVSASTTISNIAESSTRGTANWEIPNGSNPDRIIVDVQNQDATCNLLKFENIRTTGPIVLERIHAGDILFEGLNQIGTGSGINSSDFILTATVNQNNLAILDKPTIGSR